MAGDAISERTQSIGTTAAGENVVLDAPVGTPGWAVFKNQGRRTTSRSAFRCPARSTFEALDRRVELPGAARVRGERHLRPGQHRRHSAESQDRGGVSPRVPLSPFSHRKESPVFQTETYEQIVYGNIGGNITINVTISGHRDAREAGTKLADKVHKAAVAKFEALTKPKPVTGAAGDGVTDDTNAVKAAANVDENWVGEQVPAGE
jgi:hypothetical protein